MHFLLSLESSKIYIKIQIKIAPTSLGLRPSSGSLYWAWLKLYRVIHKSLRDFRTRMRNNQDRHGRKEHVNR